MYSILDKYFKPVTPHICDEIEQRKKYIKYIEKKVIICVTNTCDKGYC